MHLCFQTECSLAWLEVNFTLAVAVVAAAAAAVVRCVAGKAWMNNQSQKCYVAVLFCVLASR